MFVATHILSLQGEETGRFNAELTYTHVLTISFGRHRRSLSVNPDNPAPPRPFRGMFTRFR